MNYGDDARDEGIPLQEVQRDQSSFNSKRIVDSFRQWTEDEFSQKVLVPLLSRMG